MKLSLKALCLVLLITVFASCKKDDGGSVEPPRDYTVQYATEKPLIEEYLKTHYIVQKEDFTFEFDTLTDSTHKSIWEQTDYPLQSMKVHSIDASTTNNTPEYTIYYLNFAQGEGDMPTRADNVITTYKGTLLDGTVFDSQTFGTGYSSLGIAIEGWQFVIPKFNSGFYNDVPDSPDPATFSNYGSGAMFIPSGLAYYNVSKSNLMPTYSPLIFTFNLLSVNYVDTDSDGILSKDEVGKPGDDPYYYDTDGDGTPNFMDTDDDADGYLTKAEITKPDGTLYSFDEIPTCTDGIKKRHLDPACHQPVN